MFAAIVGAVVGRVVVDDFDVRNEAGARVSAFDQIVTEERVAWKAVL